MKISTGRAGVIAALLSSLATLVSTGAAPAERNAYELYQPRVSYRREKRPPSQSLAAKQYARYYLGDKRSRDVRE